MKFPRAKDRFLIVNTKRLQVFGSENIKIRIQHLKTHRIISRKSSWGMEAAKLNENRAQITA